MKNLPSRMNRMKYRIKNMFTASIALVVATACYSRRISDGTHLNSDLLSADARSCGMVVSLGKAVSGSGPEHEVNIRLQAITCGDDGKNANHLWHAIGASADRQEVFLQKNGSSSNAKISVQNGTSIKLIDVASGAHSPIGSVEQDSYAIPVKLNAGVSAEFRSKGQVVPLSGLKSVAPNELEIWFVIGG